MLLLYHFVHDSIIMYWHDGKHVCYWSSRWGEGHPGIASTFENLGDAHACYKEIKTMSILHWEDA